MDDPAELLRDLGEETVGELEALLEELGFELEVVFYRKEGDVKKWEARK